MEERRKCKKRGDPFAGNNTDFLSYSQKDKGRMRYIRWAVELYESSIEEVTGSKINRKNEELIAQEVRKAVEKLSSEERLFIEKFYFEFKSYREISKILNKRVKKLERIHRRALDKLRITLADFVKTRFKLEIPKKIDCVICRSPFQAEIDMLIKKKKKEETYARLIRTFKRKYGIDIKTPQAIIGHQRKHMV
jgi:RNA polymerase sigma factor (sigma-70 family)